MERDKVEEICKIGQQEKCCSYLGAAKDGFECLKTQPGLKEMIDERRNLGRMNAKGDNCKGYDNEKKEYLE